MSNPRTLLAAIAVALLLLPARAGAEGGVFTVREKGLHIAGGVNPSSMIEYYAIHGHVGFRFWESLDRWFRERHMTARWIIEPWVAFVSDRHGVHQTDSFEIGVSALFARVAFGDGAFRPFLEGGEGILYTDLRKQDYGTRILFSSQIGGGFQYDIRPDLAFTFSARLRHTSNAGLASSNPGVNTFFGMVGLTFK
jgi:hypothetical protein